MSDHEDDCGCKGSNFDDPAVVLEERVVRISAAARLYVARFRLGSPVNVTRFPDDLPVTDRVIEEVRILSTVLASGERKPVLFDATTMATKYCCQSRGGYGWRCRNRQSCNRRCMTKSDFEDVLRSCYGLCGYLATYSLPCC